MSNDEKPEYPWCEGRAEVALRHSPRSLGAHARILSLVALAGLFGGCAGLSERIQEPLRVSRFDLARQMLDEEGVGASLRADAGPEELAARDAFCKAIEAAAEEAIREKVARGKVREALAAVKADLALCPWSLRLVQLVAEEQQRIDQISQAEQEWGKLLSFGTPSPEELRAILAEFAIRPLWFFDSATLPELREVATVRLRDQALSTVVRLRGRLGKFESAVLESDLRACGIATHEWSRLRAILEVLGRMPEADQSSVGRLRPDELAAMDVVVGSDRVPTRARRSARPAEVEEAHAAAASPVRASGPDASGSTKRLRGVEDCIDYCWHKADEWLLLRLGALLGSEDVQYADVARAETLLGLDDMAKGLMPSLAQAHVVIARRLASHGLGAALACTHMTRAAQLGSAVDAPSRDAITVLARATLAASERPTIALKFQCNPEVDPRTESLLAWAIGRTLVSDEKALSKLNPFADAADGLQVVFDIRKADYVIDFSDVKDVRSTWLSHMQTVPNPRKQSLETSCDFAKRRVEDAQSDYRWEVDIHNRWPSFASLSRVNMAYSDYSQAVDDFNSYVSRYNATPSTIEEPVYLPYSFREGDVRFGWMADLSVAVGETTPEPLAVSTVVTDHLRMGSKVDDKDDKNRRADPLSIDVTAEGGMQKLFQLTEEVRDAMRVRLGRLSFPTTAQLDPEQNSTLGWICHPFGMKADLVSVLGVPKWAADCAPVALANLDLKQEKPPVASLHPSNVVWDASVTAEIGAERLSQFVCQTRVSKADATTQGSGCLVGPGLVLTCAHVLRAPGVSLTFASGPWKGDYEAQVAFVNSEKDVALLRIEGLRNESWARVRLEEPSKAGEPILAIGNPGMDVGGTNRGGVSAGVVSNPELEQKGSTYLAADISVASGSSGGPLFSLKDGSLIGVVQLVATAPGFSDRGRGVDATGFLALAAPSQQLSEWLGLQSDSGPARK